MDERTNVSQAEMKVLEKIWAKGDMVTVPEMVSMLKEEKEEWAYQTIATFLRRLEEKKMLSSTKQGRNLCYFPIVSKEQYEKMEAHNFVKNKFHGSLKKFLIAFSGNDVPDIENIKELREWLDELDT